MVSLSALFFFKENLNKVSTIDDLILGLENLNVQEFIDDDDKFSLRLGDDFYNFSLKIAEALQNRLDVKKEAKLEYTNEEWIPSDTNKWLKKDGTYKEIYQKVLARLKQ